MSKLDEGPAGEPAEGQAARWRPGDPDRRRTARSLLDATNTTRDEHLPPPNGKERRKRH